MKVDLHIHSALSPCASDDMTPHNIVNMAKICELDVISVCDHNSLAQQTMMMNIAHVHKMNYLIGVEVQTIEDVHICCYFKMMEDSERFGEWINQNLLPIENDIRFFGNQWICDENDHGVKQEKRLLLQSVQETIENVCVQCHENHGLVSLAHACDRTNSILTQLGFIPQNLEFDMIEIKNDEQKEKILAMHPWLKYVFWIKNSDAHYLEDIGCYEDEIDEQEFEALWSKWL